MPPARALHYKSSLLAGRFFFYGKQESSLSLDLYLPAGFSFRSLSRIQLEGAMGMKLGLIFMMKIIVLKHTMFLAYPLN